MNRYTFAVFVAVALGGCGEGDRVADPDYVEPDGGPRHEITRTLPVVECRPDAVCIRYRTDVDDAPDGETYGTPGCLDYQNVVDLTYRTNTPRCHDGVPSCPTDGYHVGCGCPAGDGCDWDR